MPDKIIACLSQKGGVGKSTLARLIARTYAAGGWVVKIADFNTTQLTSHNWGQLRRKDELLPQIATEPYTQPSKLRRETVDLVVADGRPDSDQSSLDIARIADLVVLPTGLSLDDLEPQLRFADELVSKGVSPERIFFVLNKTSESNAAIADARTYLSRYTVAENDLTNKISYQRAQNFGRALSECGAQFGKLEDKANLVAGEVVGRISKIEEITQ